MKLASKLANKKEFVRGCVERLKSIELRLDHGCASGWLKDVEAVDDLLGVAQQMVPLLKLANLEAPQQPFTDMDSAELSRSVMRLLDDVDRAVAPARKPTDMIGECVLKHFEGHGAFMGTIVEYDEHTGFRLMVRARLAATRDARVASSPRRRSG